MSDKRGQEMNEMDRGLRDENGEKHRRDRPRRTLGVVAPPPPPLKFKPIKQNRHSLIPKTN